MQSIPDFQPEWPSEGYQVAVVPADGKTYLLTPADRVTGEDGVLVLRLLPDGLPDPTWTTAAINAVAALAVQASGQLLVAASGSADLLVTFWQ